MSPTRRVRDTAGEADGAEPPAPDPALVKELTADGSPKVASPARREFSEPLERVQKAARARKRCEERTLAELQEAVQVARDARHSLREIAAVADVSYDTIDRWTKA